MNAFFYGIKPYVVIVIGMTALFNPTTWWGTLSGAVLVAAGALIVAMRRQARVKPE